MLDGLFWLPRDLWITNLDLFMINLRLFSDASGD